MPSTKGWIGVDFDGTLVKYNRGDLDKNGPLHVGDPIPEMVARVKKWLEAGQEVRIFTARVSPVWDDVERQRSAAVSTLVIQQWCEDNLGQALPVTCQKDYDMRELWDDRARQVEMNTGELA